MNPCGLTRLLVPAFVVGLAVATFARSDLYGWVAAGITVGALAIVQKVRGTATTCAVTLPPATEHEALEADRPEAGSADVPSRRSREPSCAGHRPGRPLARSAGPARLPVASPLPR
jgi:hypothetical protein